MSIREQSRLGRRAIVLGGVGAAFGLGLAAGRLWPAPEKPSTWRETLTLWDDFTTHPPGRLAGQRAPSGQMWARVTYPHIVSPTVASSGLVAPSAAPRTTAAYAVADIGRTITRMRATISWQAGGNGSCVVLIISPTFTANSIDYIVQDRSIHIAFTPRQILVAFYSDGQISYLPAVKHAEMTTDGQQYDIGFDLVGDQATFSGPDGTIEQRTDLRFVEHAGQYATFEHYYPADAAVPTIHRVGAS